MVTRPAKIVSSLALPVLFGCGSATEVMTGWETRVEGLVLEYADSTQVTTVPVSGARVFLLLPEEAETYCLLVLCDVDLPDEVTTGGSGAYSFTFVDPAACTLRVRADVTRIDPVDGTPALRTAEAPQVAPGCGEGQAVGVTLILEDG